MEPLLTANAHRRAVELPGVANPFLARKRKPLVVGHRGVPALHQENTLAGFRRAVALGLDAIELDVRVTRDGRAVVIHDNSLERLTGVRRAVADLTWDELSALRIRRELDVGADPLGERVIARYEREERISLLEEVLAEVGHRVAINLELKARWLGDELAAIVAELIARARVATRVMVTSFDPRPLRELARTATQLALGYCWDESMLGFAGLPGRRLLSHALGSNVAGRWFGAHAVGADHALVGRETVQRVHGQGLAIGVHVLFPIAGSLAKTVPWTAMSPAEAERLAALGVDWIESDDPERLQRVLG
jgi:glycerophosphoryl diester phosphodiesterase